MLGDHVEPARAAAWCISTWRVCEREAMRWVQWPCEGEDVEEEEDQGE